MEESDRDYYILVVCFDRKGVYSHTVRIEKSKGYDVVESWSRTNNGLSEIIDMRKISIDIRNGSVRNY